MTKPRRVNLGCGRDYRPDWHNVDIRNDIKTDDCIDLNSHPWNLPTDYWDVALMDNVIEHLDDRQTAFKDLHRILKPGGRAIVRFPHWNSAGHYTTPSHTKTITHRTPTHDEVGDLFERESVNCTRVRFGRLLPETVALLAAEHVGHIVSEVEVELEVRP